LASLREILTIVSSLGEAARAQALIPGGRSIPFVTPTAQISLCGGTTRPAMIVEAQI
jgi:hypothetical protein